MLRKGEPSQAENDTDVFEPIRSIDDCAAGMNVELGFGDQLPAS